MPNLYWVYFPDRYPEDVLLFNFESAVSWSLRLYHEPDRRPKKLALVDIGVDGARAVLAEAAWSKHVEPGISVDTKTVWWRGQARSALREARSSLSE